MRTMSRMDDHGIGKPRADVTLAQTEILEELQGRLTAPIGEADALAISTAVDKAIAVGFDAGVARFAFEVVELHGLTVDLSPPGALDVGDRWAERFGSPGS